MIGLIIELIPACILFILAILLQIILAQLHLLRGFIINIRLMDSVFIGAIIGVCLIFKKELPEIDNLIKIKIPLFISIAIAIAIAVIVYRIQRNKIVYTITSIIVSPVWAIVGSIIFSVFNDSKRNFWIVFAIITLSNLYFHFNQRNYIPESVLE